MFAKVLLRKAGVNLLWRKLLQSKCSVSTATVDLKPFASLPGSSGQVLLQHTLEIDGWGELVIHKFLTIE